MYYVAGTDWVWVRPQSIDLQGISARFQEVWPRLAVKSD